jgi:D-alanyl-lipoteichoic acid acyltransferase DltB (MBOAT superfamily)
MDSASFEFIAFGLVVALLSNLSSSRLWRSVILFFASLLLLWILSPGVIALVPLVGFLTLGYVSVILIRDGRKRLTSFAIIVVIFAFIWLKKYSFLPTAIFLHFPYFTIGLSYIFFRVLHLVIESGEDGPIRSISLGAYLLYTINFTTLISGPIQRYEDFARDQFAEQPITLNTLIVGAQIERIIRGYFKVSVLALIFSMVQADMLTRMSQHIPAAQKLVPAFLLSIVYPFFLYANFSGYIDIVIAIARLMHIRLPENFDRPFSATSFIDFWNRWHITLSSWLKTYVYNPLLLALMRRITSLTLEPFLGVFCFFVTFFLVGIWHGRTSEYVVFGVLQGGGVAINKLWQLQLTKWMGRKPYRALSENPIYCAFGRGLTFTWFAFTMFWFWGNWSQIHTIFSSLSFGCWLLIWSIVWVTATAVLAAFEEVRARLLTITIGNQQILISRYARVVYATVFAVVSFIMSAILAQPSPDIVYKAF